MYKKNFILSFCLSLITLQSCVSWHTLEFKTENQPVQFGPHLLTNTQIDTLGEISGISTHNYEEDTYSQSKHLNITFEGKNEVKENVNTTIYKALSDDPGHFIADGQLVVEVKYGISLGSVFLGMIASMITNDDSDIGTYNTESIYYNGIVYKIKSGKKQK